MYLHSHHASSFGHRLQALDMEARPSYSFHNLYFSLSVNTFVKIWIINPVSIMCKKVFIHHLSVKLHFVSFEHRISVLDSLIVAVLDWNLKFVFFIIRRFVLDYYFVIEKIVGYWLLITFPANKKSISKEIPSF